MSESQDRRADRSLPTRDALLEATRRIVATEGLGAATSRRITDTAGANLGSITYHFGSKDALVAAALASQVERLVEPTLEVLEAEGDGTARLLAAVRELLATFAEERDHAPVYLAALLEAAHDASDAGTTRAVVGRLRDRLSSVITDLRGAGTVPGWVDPVVMSSLLIATANGIALQTSVDPGGPAPEAMAAQLAQLLLAVRADAAPHDGGSGPSTPKS